MSGDSEKDAVWNELFARHLERLQEHLDLWRHVQEKQSPGTESHDAARVCLSNTQEMIQNFANLQTSFTGTDGALPATAPTNQKRHLEINLEEEILGEKEDVSIRQSKRKRTIRKTSETEATFTEPLNDASGLFTIDTNPTPIEQLLAQKSNAKVMVKGKSRKKDSHSNSTPIGATDGGHVPPAAMVSNDAENRDPSSHAKPEDDDDDNDDFIARAAKRHDEEEAKRQRKHDKKRKRSSNTSLGDYASGDVKPGSKKPKKEHPSKKKRKIRGDGPGSSGQPHATQEAGGSTKKRKKK